MAVPALGEPSGRLASPQAAWEPHAARMDGAPVNVLWMTGGLGCDGDSIAMTAATSPSLEDLLRGCFPGMPPVVIHNPVFAYETGEEFMRVFFDAAAGRLEPFILVLEGSVPNEEINGDGHWAAFGVDPATGEPIPTCSWIDRLAPRAAVVLAVGTCAAYGGIPAMRNNPTGAMGLRDYLGGDWTSTLGIPIVNLPGCPVQPDNITETLLCIALHLAGIGPALALDEQGRPQRIFGRTAHESCNRAGLAEHGQFADIHGDGRCLVKLGCKGPVVKCNVPTRGWINGIGGCPNVGRHLHGMHHARLSRQIHAIRAGRHRQPALHDRRPVQLRPRAQIPARAPDSQRVRRRAGLATAIGPAGDRLPKAVVNICH